MVYIGTVSDPGYRNDTTKSFVNDKLYQAIDRIRQECELDAPLASGLNSTWSLTQGWRGKKSLKKCSNCQCTPDRFTEAGIPSPRFYNMDPTQPDGRALCSTCYQYRATHNTDRPIALETRRQQRDQYKGKYNNAGYQICEYDGCGTDISVSKRRFDVPNSRWLCATCYGRRNKEHCDECDVYILDMTEHRQSQQHLKAVAGITKRIRIRHKKHCDECDVDVLDMTVHRKSQMHLIAIGEITAAQARNNTRCKAKEHCDECNVDVLDITAHRKRQQHLQTVARITAAQASSEKRKLADCDNASQTIKKHCASKASSNTAPVNTPPSAPPGPTATSYPPYAYPTTAYHPQYAPPTAAYYSPYTPLPPAHYNLSPYTHAYHPPYAPQPTAHYNLPPYGYPPTAYHPPYGHPPTVYYPPYAPPPTHYHAPHAPSTTSQSTEVGTSAAVAAAVAAAEAAANK